MTDETTIVFELTPTEAAILSEMLSVYSWSKGPYGEKVRAMYYELENCSSAYDHIRPPPITVSEVGTLEPGAIWLENLKTHL